MAIQFWKTMVGAASRSIMRRPRMGGQRTCQRTFQRHAIKNQRSIETLEPRVVLDGSGLTWTDTSQITLSFAADGTDIGGESNALFQTFQNSGFAEHEWQNAILRAFQTWAKPTTANVGLVDERPMPSGTSFEPMPNDGVEPLDDVPGDGSPIDEVPIDLSDHVGYPFGTQGPRNQDRRFGDVRIGARPLSKDVKALAIANGTVTAGTWSGDMIFNSEAKFESIRELFGVALHEAGHVFGLDESSDPTSPMFPGADPPNIVPTIQDRVDIRLRHGQRLPDQYENNNSIITATPVKATTAIVSGQVPAVLFANLHAEDDVDFYEIPALRGSAEIELKTAGISLLAANYRVHREWVGADGIVNSMVVDHQEADKISGDVFRTSIDAVDPNSRYFVEVSGTKHQRVSELFRVGAYTLSARYRPFVEIEPTAIDAEIRNRNLKYSWVPDQHDAVTSNDTMLSATYLEFEPEVIRGEQNAVRIANLHYGGDVDFFQWSIPEQFVGKLQVNVRTGSRLHSLDWQINATSDLAADGLVTYVPTDIDDMTSAVEFTADASKEYFLRIASNPTSDISTPGTYAIIFTFDPETFVPVDEIYDTLIQLDASPIGFPPLPDDFDAAASNNHHIDAANRTFAADVMRGSRPEVLYANFHISGDVDFYRFQLGSASEFQVNLHGGRRAANVEMQIYTVLNVDQVNLNDLDFDTRLVSTILLEPGMKLIHGDWLASEPNATYFVRVESLDPNRLPANYGLSFVIDPPNSVSFDDVDSQIGNSDSRAQAVLPDEFEADGGNDTLDDSSNIPFPESFEPGLAPVIFFSDLHSSNDVDHFQLPMPAELAGAFTVRLYLGNQLRSPDISVFRRLAFNEPLELIPEFETVPSEFLQANATTVELKIKNVGPDYNYFVRIRTIESAASATSIGSYGVVVLHEPSEPIEVVADVLGDSLRSLSQDDIAAIFAGELIGTSEIVSDDIPAEAVPIVERPGFVPFTVYEAFGSLTDAEDIDHYKITTNGQLHRSSIYIQSSIRSLPNSNNYPDVEVVEGSGLFENEILVDGTGELVVQTRLEPGHTYVIRVGTRPTFQIGNYHLTVYFTNSPILMHELASDDLQTNRDFSHSFTVNQTKLSHFALQVDAMGRDADLDLKRVVAKIYDADQRLVQGIVSATGFTRSSFSVLLDPGDYTVEFETAGAILGANDFTPVATLLASKITDPFGLEPNDPTGDYFQCEEGDLFCYPGDITDDDSTVYDRFLDSLYTFPAGELLEAVEQELWWNWWDWYWNIEIGLWSFPKPDTYQTSVDRAINQNQFFGLTFNDKNPTSLEVTPGEGPQHGTITLHPNGSFLYTPDPGFVGIDRFKYRFQSAQLSALVEIVVEPDEEGDYSGNGLLTADDIDRFSEVLRNPQYRDPLFYDFNDDWLVNDADYHILITEVFATTYGNANLDSVFDSSDLIAVMVANKFEDGIAGGTTWAEGDWNHDGEFDTSDLIRALQHGQYEGSPQGAMPSIATNNVASHGMQLASDDLDRKKEKKSRPPIAFIA